MVLRFALSWEVIDDTMGVKVRLKHLVMVEATKVPTTVTKTPSQSSLERFWFIRVSDRENVNRSF